MAMTLGTRRLIAWLALLAFGLVLAGQISGVDWLGFVAGLMK
jgi:hypothetical protein